MLGLMISRKPTEQGRHSGPARAGGAPPMAAPEAPVDPSNDDWAEPGASTSTASCEAVARLDQAVAGLGPYLAEAFIPASAVINPLLDVWDAAHSIDPCASSPVEPLLTVLVTRTWVTPSELTATLDEVRAAALEASLLLNALASA